MSTTNDSLSRTYAYSLERAVSRLRSAADRIERVGQPYQRGRDPHPMHVRAALEVMSEVRGLMGNLTLETLVENAHVADTLWETGPAADVPQAEVNR
jgi:hypothetical protein